MIKYEIKEIIKMTKITTVISGVVISDLRPKELKMHQLEFDLEEEAKKALDESVNICLFIYQKPKK